MKVPTKVIDIAINIADGKPVTDDDRKYLGVWAQAGKEKRAAGALEAAKKLLDAHAATAAK